jgi:hypothetical protein
LTIQCTPNNKSSSTSSKRQQRQHQHQVRHVDERIVCYVFAHRAAQTPVSEPARAPLAPLLAR